jgi:hypothetical protein
LPREQMDIISVGGVTSIQIDSISKIMMCSDASGTSYDILVLKYSPSGVLQWQNVYGGEGDDEVQGNFPCSVRSDTLST